VSPASPLVSQAQVLRQMSSTNSDLQARAMTGQLLRARFRILNGWCLSRLFIGLSSVQSQKK
jgi:hypothetical protein